MLFECDLGVGGLERDLEHRCVIWSAGACLRVIPGLVCFPYPLLLFLGNMPEPSTSHDASGTDFSSHIQAQSACTVPANYERRRTRVLNCWQQVV